MLHKLFSIGIFVRTTFSLELADSWISEFDGDRLQPLVPTPPLTEPILSRSPALLSYPELLQCDALFFFFCDGLLGLDALVECNEDNDAFVKELAPPLPPLFDLSLTNLHVLIKEDVLVSPVTITRHSNQALQ